jgi:predicted RNA-binding protein YlxR (DUF448 family)
VATKRRRQGTKNSASRRTCLGCGETDEQSALLRIAIREDGELEINRWGKGRGGYLHAAETCWDLFLRKKSIYRAFHKEFDRAVKERLVLVLRERR